MDVWELGLVRAAVSAVTGVAHIKCQSQLCWSHPLPFGLIGSGLIVTNVHSGLAHFLMVMLMKSSFFTLPASTLQASQHALPFFPQTGWPSWPWDGHAPMPSLARQLEILTAWHVFHLLRCLFFWVRRPGGLWPLKGLDCHF